MGVARSFELSEWAPRASLPTPPFIGAAIGCCQFRLVLRISNLLGQPKRRRHFASVACRA